MGKLEDIQVFIRIVESGGISKAADSLGIAKSSVSRCLSSLETRLKIKLFNRTTRSFHLTEDGNHYFAKALKSYQQFQELDDFTQSINIKNNLSLEGILSVSLPLSFGLLHMNSLLSEFAKLHPSLKLNINFSDSQVNLVEEGYDLSLRIAKLTDSTLQAKKLVPINLAIVASPDYLHKFGTPTHFTDLKSQQLFGYNYDKQHWKFTDKAGAEHKIKAEGQFSANNGEFLMNMAIAGHGIVTMPTFICWQYLQTGRLVKILTDYQIPVLNLYAIYPQSHYLSSKARYFIDYMSKKIKQNQYWN